MKTLTQLIEAMSKTNLRYEIFVVDNDSSDRTTDVVKGSFPSIKLLQNDQNVGYAKANNQAIRLSTAPYILLLNSDTLVRRKTIDFMISYMESHPKVGVATCAVYLENGQLDPACHRGFPTPWASLTYFLGLEKLFPQIKWLSGYHLLYLPLSKEHEIDSPSGAFYFVRRRVIDEVGLLDENFFMYGEDLDWSFRIKQAGWKIMFVPDVAITHLKKKSGRQSDREESRKLATEAFYDTMKIFYQKHYSRIYPKVVNWFIFWVITLLKKKDMVTV